MNLLEQEDFVKGWPDTKLLEYMKNPDGTVNYAVAGAEVSFRNKQRKNFAENQSKLPENTVLEKELNQFEKGIMSLPQQQPVFPPPQIDQIPKGPGILDDPNSPINMSPEQFDQRFRNPDILPPGNPDDPIRMNEGGMIPYYTPDYSPENYQKRQRFEESIFNPNRLFNVAAEPSFNPLFRERTSGTYDIPATLTEEEYKRMIQETPGAVRLEEGIPDYIYEAYMPELKEYKGEDLSLDERLEILGNLGSPLLIPSELRHLSPQDYDKRQTIPTDSAGATLQDSPQIPEFMQYTGRTSNDKSVSGYIEGQSGTTRGMLDNIISNFSETYEPDYSFSSKVKESLDKNIDALADLERQSAAAETSGINSIEGLLEKLTKNKEQAAEKRSSAREAYLESEKNRKFGIEDLIAEARARKVDFSEQEAQQRRSTDAGIASLLAAAFAAPTQDQRARILTGMTGLYQDEADRLTDLSREQQLLNMGYEDEARELALRQREMEFDRDSRLAELGYNFEMAGLDEQERTNEIIHGFKVELSNARTEADKQAIRNQMQRIGMINDNEIRILEVQKQEEDMAFNRAMQVFRLRKELKQDDFEQKMALLNYQRNRSAEFNDSLNTIMNAYNMLIEKTAYSDDVNTKLHLARLEKEMMKLMDTLVP
jgi:hypothetical protein